MSKEALAQNASLTFNGVHAAQLAKIFVICNQKDSAPMWGNILRQRGLIVILETS